jgi:oligoendopeptidase F
MSKTTQIIILLTIILSVNAMAQKELPTRDEIPDKYKWDLTDIYKDEAAWQKDYDKVKSKLPELAAFKGKISKSAKDLYAFLTLSNEVEAIFNRIYIYTACGRDIQLDNSSFQIMYAKMQKLGSELSAATAFFNPELMTLNNEQMEQFYKDEPRLLEFKHFLEQKFLRREHIMSADNERLMAELSPVFAIPVNTYGILNDAELPFPKIKDPEGNEIQVSHGRYRAGLFSQDRDYRRDIYKATYVPYDMLKGTMAELYNGRVKERITFAKLRKYNSAVEAALKPNNIPVSVYENLVRVTRDNVKTLHRWAKIRKQVLKLDEFHPYDTYVSLFPSVSKEYTFEEAKEIALKALAPLGEEYIAAVKKSFDNRWIDVYETKSKRSGAYSNSSGSGPHPFILLNWNNTLDDLFTLVHEVGHNMHSYFTEKAQPFQYRDYATFVAEVASISNEALLTDYLLENAKTKEEKLMLYEKFLTGVQATFFRQTRFAEYEKIIHEKAEKGEFMTADMLTKEFASLYQYYWGDNMTVDYEEGLSWARIPHLFKYNFYVYQYATGFAAAFALTRNIKNEGRPAIERYLKFLSSGSSKYPIDILKDAGVDMTKPDAVEALIKKANEYLDELEQLIK